MGARTNRTRIGAVTVAAVLGLAAAVVVATNAWAGASPSSATPLTVGVPFTATVRSGSEYEWLRLPQRLLPSDRVRFTMDSNGVTANMRVCLAPDTDDFGQQDMESACSAPGYTGDIPHVDMDSGKFRRTLDWNDDATNGFVLVTSGCGACTDRDVTFTITLEAQIHQVRLGTPKVTRSGRHVTVSAPALLTDNSAAPDGHPGSLHVRYPGRKFRSVAQGTVSAGALNMGFKAKRRYRKATVRLCTTPIGSTGKLCSTKKRVRLRK
jgi:hypothetical protein